MKHADIQQKLLGLYDGPLSEKERQLVQRHLYDCPDCRQAIEDCKNIAGALFPPMAFSEPEEDLCVSKVMARVRSSKPRPWVDAWNQSLKWLTPLAGLAAAAVWTFFSVLPSTPGVMPHSLAESFLYQEPSDNPSFTGGANRHSSSTVTRRLASRPSQAYGRYAPSKAPLYTPSFLNQPVGYSGAIDDFNQFIAKSRSLRNFRSSDNTPSLNAVNSYAPGQFVHPVVLNY